MAILKEVEVEGEIKRMDMVLCQELRVVEEEEEQQQEQDRGYRGSLQPITNTRAKQLLTMMVRDQHH
jgi:predicted RNA-binding protein with PUA-like domain